MPSKAYSKRIYDKERKGGKKLSGCGSICFIPNRPLQGEMIIDGKRVLGRSRTYPGSPGRLSQNKVSGSEVRKSASLNDVNRPRFSKLKFGKQLPFVGCDNCTPWVVCTEHEAWLTIPGHANYTPIFGTQETPKFHGVSSSPSNETPVTSKAGPKAKKPRGREGGRPKKSLNETPKESYEEFEKRVDDSMKELNLNTPLST